MRRMLRYFPWKVARQHFLSHFIFILVTMILTGFTLRYYVYSSFSDFAPTAELTEALDKFDSYLTSLFVMVLLASGAFFTLSTRYYAQPLGRLIRRARTLRRLTVPVSELEIAPEELEEEPGEWYDLERALNRIHRDLRTKTNALSREREELSALIGAVSDAILAVDIEENPLFYNSQFALMFPFAREEKESGRARTLGEIFRVPEVLKGFRDVLDDGKMTIVSASILTAHHATPRHFSISIAPLRASEDEPVYGAVGVFHDVTELKQSEQIRIEFVGNASHELRTPLTNIKGYVETLRSDIHVGRMDAAGSFIDIIARNVDRMIALVNDLLDLSIIESGAALKRVAVSTREVTESAIKQLESKRAAKKQKINVSTQTSSVTGDPRRIEQVLVNLVHNAIKYIPEEKEISITWESTESGTLLRVRDNGPGIKPEHQARIFERFYRVDAGRTRDQGGTGLGLSIVKHIMIKHGGSVRIQSRPGEGSEFICEFPG